MYLLGKDTGSRERIELIFIQDANAQDPQVRRIVLLAPHSRCFLDSNPEFRNLQRYAKQMDKAIKATYLVGVGLPYWSYWSDLVIESFNEDEWNSGEEDSQEEKMY